MKQKTIEGLMGLIAVFGTADDLHAVEAYARDLMEQARLQGSDQERALWELAKIGQEMERPNASQQLAKAAELVPLTDEQLLHFLRYADPETRRLPEGLKAFARAIEIYHGIGGKA